MKKFFTITFIGILTSVLISCGPTKEEAIDYNDKIINEQVAIIGKINKLYDALENYTDHSGMDMAYQNAINQVKTGVVVVENMKKFGGSTEFRDAALILFGTYQSVLDNEFKRMIELQKYPDELYTTEVKNEYAKLNDVSFKKMDDGLIELKVIQAKFADKYKFEIKKSY